jgi:hypothetical protein
MGLDQTSATGRSGPLPPMTWTWPGVETAVTVARPPPPKGSDSLQGRRELGEGACVEGGAIQGLAEGAGGAAEDVDHVADDEGAVADVVAGLWHGERGLPGADVAIGQDGCLDDAAGGPLGSLSLRSVGIDCSAEDIQISAEDGASVESAGLGQGGGRDDELVLLGRNGVGEKEVMQGQQGE